MMNEIKGKIMPGAGPFYFEGNQIGILMIPGGGGGTCADLKPLAEDLRKVVDYTIHIPLLPGIGTSPEDLRRTSIDDWNRAMEKEFNILRNKTEKIFLGGHSLGALLTLLFATKRNDLNGIFTISAPVGLKGIAPKLVPILKPFIKYHAIPSEKFREETGGKWVGYDKIPVNIVSKINKMIKELKAQLSTITAPILLFQGRFDENIKGESMNYIYENINSSTKKKIWLEHSGHAILEIPDHDLIVKELLKFFKKNCS
ncbi:MAG: alpha/beta fold hydrolase [Promethearchaeota archaeon]|nr:MAG: alpha/beta fold hydrolase [Candidatus Lokiarchaeota archaeon]